MASYPSLENIQLGALISGGFFLTNQEDFFRTLYTRTHFLQTTVVAFVARVNTSTNLQSFAKLFCLDIHDNFLWHFNQMKTFFICRDLTSYECTNWRVRVLCDYWFVQIFLMLKMSLKFHRVTIETYHLTLLID